MAETWPLDINFDTDSMEFHIDLPSLEYHYRDMGKSRKFAFVAKIWNKHNENTKLSYQLDDDVPKENVPTRRRSLDLLRRRRKNTGSKSPLLQKSLNKKLNVFLPPGFKDLTGKWNKDDIAISSSISPNTSNSVANGSNHSDSSLFDSFTSSKSSLPVFTSHPKQDLAFNPGTTYPIPLRPSYSLPLKSILKNRNDNFAVEYESVKKSDLVGLEEFLKSFEAEQPQITWDNLPNITTQEVLFELTQPVAIYN